MSQVHVERVIGLLATDEALREWESVLARDPERRDARMYLRLVGKGRE